MSMEGTSDPASYKEALEIKVLELKYNQLLEGRGRFDGFSQIDDRDLSHGGPEVHYPGSYRNSLGDPFRDLGVSPVLSTRFSQANLSQGNLPAANFESPHLRLEIGTKESEVCTPRGGEPSNEAPVKRVRHFVTTYDDSKMQWEDRDRESGSDAVISNDVKELPSVAAIFRRVMRESDAKRFHHEEIELRSDELKRIYRENTPAPPNYGQSHDSSSVHLNSPFKDLLWFWDRFETAIEPANHDTDERAVAKEDMRELMSVVRKSELAAYFKARDASLPTAPGAKMPYEHLWVLFNPGKRVYTKAFMDETQMLEVRSCQSPLLNADGGAPRAVLSAASFRVSCIAFDWDGTKFNTFEYDFEIKRTSDEGDMVIEALEVYPAHYNRKDQKMRERLLARGQKFWRLCNNMNQVFQFQYNGPVLTTSRSRSGDAHILLGRANDDDSVSMSWATATDDSGAAPSARKEYSGQVIVDAFSYLRASDDMAQRPPLDDLLVKDFVDTDCKCRACRYSPLITWQRRKIPSATSAQNQYLDFAEESDRLMLCPPRVLGYILRGKMWAQFSIDSVKERTSNSAKAREEEIERKEYFTKQLQLDDNYKEMLLAFVNNHSSRNGLAGDHTDGIDRMPMSLDIIQEKGRGLSILLHGPPGVGKTLTCETIALATDRPLLSVSVSEIGINASEAEARLNGIFAIAARWGAILLMDEADVFLEERVHTDNPNRNMLVSVLLRCLEYYEGIIFLTTNRVRSIDVAVQSRMHLAIQYKRLGQKQKLAIYQNLLEKVPDSRIAERRATLYREIRDQLCRRNELNGRQIRNIVSAAIALATERGKQGGDRRLKFEHLRTVHETTTDFLDSLKDLNSKARARNEAPELDDGDDY